MLSAAHRVTEADLFREVIRRGRRSGGRAIVVHCWQAPDQAPPRVGFVVSKAVGNAVIRNRVKRRLRHLTRERLSVLPGSVVLVVRALPASATASSAELGRELDASLRRLLP